MAIIPSSHRSQSNITFVYTRLMNSKKLPKPTTKDKAWQQRVEKKTTQENVQLGQSEGKERFDQTLLNSLKKPKK